MGNRGILHDAKGQLGVSRWKTSAWIICRLEFKGRQREVMQPGSYTELFFLDEATALAAGHRPCYECRREAAVRFRALWKTANPGVAVRSIKDVDRQLHHERVVRSREKVTYRATIDELPQGTYIMLDDAPEQAVLLWDGALLVWSPEGYGERQGKPDGAMVTVLTPRSTVRAIAAGYVPGVHRSAG